MHYRYVKNASQTWILYLDDLELNLNVYAWKSTETFTLVLDGRFNKVQHEYFSAIAVARVCPSIIVVRPSSVRKMRFSGIFVRINAFFCGKLFTISPDIYVLFQEFFKKSLKFNFFSFPLTWGLPYWREYFKTLVLLQS